MAGDSGRVSPLQRRCRWGPAGPSEDTPRRAAEQRCSWTQARPLTVLGPARDRDRAIQHRGGGTAPGHITRPFDQWRSTGPWQLPMRR
ncbi:hypothetical protein NDU88_002574 [Pleurodeles waltl]|uniref:Uncharacterized protein n=1 Tax=Pleurodeles waltl TaxID=8319 RepID=A0AAV7UWK3_PLEWA|nr:hypothetical protein NDU88_002574 [Pleurodeles waltl]